MSLRVTAVDPCAFAAEASRVLQEAWQPPCLWYSAEYVRWQFRFPGPLPAWGVAVFDGDEPVAFQGGLPRLLRLGGDRLPVYLSSFHAVRPAWRGAAGAAVMRPGLRTLREKGVPSVVFVSPGSEGEQMVQRAYAAARFPCRPLGHFPTYAYLARPGQPAPALTAEETADPAEFAAAARRCGDGGRLLHDPDPEGWGHYRGDPRGRALIVLRGPGGEPAGAALAVRAEVLGPQGLGGFATLDCVFLPAPSAEALRALGAFVAARWTGRVDSPVVLAPNLQGVPPEVLRAAGFRLTPSAFNGYFFSPTEGHPFLKAEGTNLEIV
jgi:hypothetical protein